MKRIFLLLYIFLLLSLAGCQGNLFSSRRDMERLRPVQTLGLDETEEGVYISVAAGTEPEGPGALVMTAPGTGIEDAVTRLQDYSPEDELFYAHNRYLLLGADAAGAGILPLLDWVERSPAMRMETPLFLVKGTAREAVTGASGEMTDVTRRLASLEREELSRGRHIYTLRQIAAALLERGGALCLAVEPVPSRDVVLGSMGDGDALLPAGYAVLRPGEEPLFLTEGESLGAELLTAGLSGARVPLEDVMLDILQGSARVRGQREDGQLTGMDIRCRLTAGILEQTGAGDADPDALEQALEAAAEHWIRAVIARSQAVGCDFLDLQGPLTADFFRGGGEARRWKEIFPGLAVNVTAEARIDRSYDLSGE